MANQPHTSRKSLCLETWASLISLELCPQLAYTVTLTRAVTSGWSFSSAIYSPVSLISGSETILLSTSLKNKMLNIRMYVLYSYQLKEFWSVLQLMCKVSAFDKELHCMVNNGNGPNKNRKLKSNHIFGSSFLSWSKTKGG